MCQERLIQKSLSQHFVSPDHAKPIDYGITRLQLLKNFGDHKGRASNLDLFKTMGQERKKHDSHSPTWILQRNETTDSSLAASFATLAS